MAIRFCVGQNRPLLAMVNNDASLAAMSLLIPASGASFASCQQVPVVESVIFLRVLRALRGNSFLCVLRVSSE